MKTLNVWAIRLSLLVGLWGVATAARAQLVGNGGFDNLSCTNVDNTFFAGCVPSWRATHGSPQVKGAGDLYAYMWSKSGQGEGIFTQVSGLVPNTQYELAFTARGFTNANLAVKLATNVTPGGGTNVSGQNIPTLNSVWAQNFWLTNNVWTRYVVRFSVPSTGDYQLCFYPETSARDDSKHEVHINDVSFDPADCLTRDVLYQNSSALPAQTRTRGNIRAGQSVDPFNTSGPAQVLANQSVWLLAGKQVSLETGFSAEQGADFIAAFAGANCAVARGTAAMDADSSWWSVKASEALGGSTRSDSIAIGEAPNQRAAPSGSSAVPVVYPNPVSERLFVQLPATSPDAAEPMAVVIYNSYGQAVRHGVAVAGRGELPVQDLVPGIYYLRWNDGTQPAGALKFEIRR